MFRSIKGKLLFSHMTIFLVMVLMILAGILAVSKMQERAAMQRLGLISSHTASMVRREITIVSEKLKNICTSQVVERFVDSYQTPALAQYFAEQSPSFGETSFIDETGFEELRIVNGEEFESGRNFKEDPSFLRSREYPGEVVIDKKIDIDDRGIHFHFLYGLNRYFGNEFVGTIIARYDLEKLSATLGLMDVGKGGLILVVDEQGRMLASPSGYASGNEVFASAPDQARILANIKEKKAFAQRGEIAGQDCFLVASPVEGMPWSVVTALPYDLFMKGVKKFRGLYLLLLAAIGCLGWVLVYLLADRLTFPIVSLRDQVVKVTLGMADTVDLKTRDEVGELVESFNDMVVDLRETSVSRDFLDKIINSMNDILLVIDQQGKVVRTNDHAQQFLGYGPIEVNDLTLYDLIHTEENNKKEWFEAMPWLLHHKPVETELVRKNGGLVPVLITSSPFLGHKGEVNGAVIVAHDISERKAAEEKLALYAEQLKESNRELEEFAYVASHDLKEPLRKITSFGERLSLKFAGQLGERGDDYLARMSNAAGRMQRLIDDLLTYSRVKTKARPFEPVDLNRIAAEVVSDLETSIADRKGKVIVSNLVTINADPTQMRQLFQNLIGNALKFHKDDEPPVVEISGRVLDDGLYQISFKDNGIGIDKKYSDRIFGVFQRLHGRQEYEGSGIGLSVCRKIVVRHGGDIVVSSTVGLGTEFLVTLDPEIQNDEVDDAEVEA